MVDFKPWLITGALSNLPSISYIRISPEGLVSLSIIRKSWLGLGYTEKLSLSEFVTEEIEAHPASLTFQS